MVTDFTLFERITVRQTSQIFDGADSKFFSMTEPLQVVLWTPALAASRYGAPYLLFTTH